MRRLAVVWAVLTLVVSPGLALAQATTSHQQGSLPLDLTQPNPCTGELVTLSGEFVMPGGIHGPIG